MRLTCPACGALSSLDVLIGHAGAREAVLAALKLPAPLGDLLIQYVALFRPAQRQLSFDKLARLLGELQPLIEAGQIERGGRIWAAPHAAWRAALDDMIAKRDKLTLPLKSHGYLLEIIAGQAGKAADRAEKASEQQRSGHTQVGVSAAHRPMRPDAPVIRNPAAAAQAIAAAKSIMKGN